MSQHPTRTPRSFHERLDMLPQDRPVTIKTYTTQYGVYYRAFWNVNRKQHSLYLGKDADGSIAAYIANKEQRTYNKHPLTEQVLVRDELGKPVYLDEDLSLFFIGDDSYVKTIFVRDGKRMVFDASVGQSGDYVSLCRWLHESHYQDEVRGGYEVVQIKHGNDYRIVNLRKQKRNEKGSVAA